MSIRLCKAFPWLPFTQSCSRAAVLMHGFVHTVPFPPPPISFTCLMFFQLLPPISPRCAYLTLSFTLQSIPAPSFERIPSRSGFPLLFQIAKLAPDALCRSIACKVTSARCAATESGNSSWTEAR